MTSWPVSRVLYGFAVARKTWRPFIWDNACALPLATHPDDRPGNRLASSAASSLFGFAPGEVYRAAMRCRRRGGLLPHPFTLTRQKPGGLLSVALSLGSPPPDFLRHRVSVEPGLSSPCRLSALAKRGRPANWSGFSSGFCEGRKGFTKMTARKRPGSPRPQACPWPSEPRRAGRSRPNSLPPPRSRPSAPRSGAIAKSRSSDNPKPNRW